jgi:preprotein translocase subunit SecY
MNGSDLANEAAKYAASENMSYYATIIENQIESAVQSLTSIFTFGGTTLLIMVGVVLETFRELEAQLTMRNYKGKGFL